MFALPRLTRISLMALLCLFVPVHFSQAGVLVLVNNDSLSGELSSVDLHHVYWQSPVLGSMTIPKRSIKKLDTRAAFKVQGSKRPCFWLGIDQSDVRFSCELGSEIRLPFLSMTVLTQFESHQASLRDVSGKVSILGAQESGNQNRDEWFFDGVVTLRYSDFRHDIEFDYESRSESNNPSLAQADLSYSFDWFFRPRWFWFTDASLERNEPINIEMRSALATGLGYQFWDKERSALSLDFGLEFSDETFFEHADVNEGDEDSITSWRASTNYRYFLPMAVELVHNNSLLISANDPGIWELQSVTRLIVPIGRSVSANIRYEYDYDNEPALSNRKEDSRLRFGVGYSW